jgi:hypothetical protein
MGCGHAKGRFSKDFIFSLLLIGAKQARKKYRREWLGELI